MRMKRIGIIVAVWVGVSLIAGAYTNYQNKKIIKAINDNLQEEEL